MLMTGGGEEEQGPGGEGGGGRGPGGALPGVGQVLGPAGVRGAAAVRAEQGEPHEDAALPQAGHTVSFHHYPFMYCNFFTLFHAPYK